MNVFGKRNPVWKRRVPSSDGRSLAVAPAAPSRAGLLPCLIAAGAVGGLISRAVAPSPAAAQEPPDKTVHCETLVCQRVEIRDTEDRLLISLGSASESGTGLLMFDGTKDHARVNIGFNTETRKAVIELRDDQKQGRILQLMPDGRFYHNLSQ